MENLKKEPKRFTFLKKLCPQLTEEELLEAEERFNKHIELCIRIVERKERERREKERKYNESNFDSNINDL